TNVIRQGADAAKYGKNWSTLNGDISDLDGVWVGRSPEVERIRIYLEDSESLIIPKDYETEVKILRPVVSVDDKFYIPLSKINKKTSKACEAYALNFEAADVLKKCCGNEWTLDDIKEVEPLEELYRPVSLPSPHILKYHKDEDIKPVTEHIEDDLKYDFRTKTHSFR
ncbi:hypothetical protein NQ317_008077, partial [Molorchus minor]